MGIFSSLRDMKACSDIDNNGLARGSGIEICEKCCYLMEDPQSNFGVCARHRMRVGANQTCDGFQFGAPLYRMT